MNFPKVLFAGLFALFATARAERVQPPDLGLSVWVPPGWVLENEGGDAEYRIYSLYDTTSAHDAFFLLEANAGVTLSESAEQWVREEALTRGLILEGNCFGSLYSDDSGSIGGNYARELYGRAATCDSSTDALLSDLKAHYMRITAVGDIGWVMGFETDTLDLDTAAGTYLRVMDSIWVDPTFQVLPQVGVHPRRYAGRVHPRVAADRHGLRVPLATEQAPEILVADPKGRRLEGRVVALERGQWGWRSESPYAGMVVVRIRSGSSQWMDRAVLSR